MFDVAEARASLRDAGIEIDREERDDKERETRLYVSRGPNWVLVAVSDDGYIALEFSSERRASIRSIAPWHKRIAHFLATGEQT